MEKISRVENRKSNLDKFKEYMYKRKIKNLKKKFISEIESIFEYNKNVLKIDTFYSCHEVDRDLKVPIFNIRDIIKDEKIDKSLSYHKIKLKYSRLYNNYLLEKRKESKVSYEKCVTDLYDEIRWFLLVSAKYDEKKVDSKFTVIVRR